MLTVVDIILTASVVFVVLGLLCWDVQALASSVFS